MFVRLRLLLRCDKSVAWYCYESTSVWSCQVTVIPSNLCFIKPPLDIISQQLIPFVLVVVLSSAVSPQCVWLQRHRLVSLARPALWQRHNPAHVWQVTLHLWLQTAPDMPLLAWFVGETCITFVSLSSFSKPEPPGAHGSKEVKGKTHTYYQVLIDTRDCPHIVSHYMFFL